MGLARGIEDAETRRRDSILIQRYDTTRMERVDVVGIVALSCNRQAWTSVCVRKSPDGFFCILSDRSRS